MATGTSAVRALHFTPTSSSWLNLVERWFAELTTKKLRRGTHTSVRQLNTDIRAWITTWNDNPRPYVWTKTAEQILASIGNYCQRINDSAHWSLLCSGSAVTMSATVALMWSPRARDHDVRSTLPAYGPCRESGSKHSGARLGHH